MHPEKAMKQLQMLQQFFMDFMLNSSLTTMVHGCSSLTRQSYLQHRLYKIKQLKKISSKKLLWCMMLA